MFSSSPPLQNPITQNSGPVPSSLGGPQFSTPRISSLHNNLRFFLIAFAVLVLSALWIHGSRPSELLTRLTKQTSALKNSIAQNVATNKKTPSITLELKNDGTTAEIPPEQIDIITQQAERGNGITHLARRAIAERMQDESLSLSPEQRIYVEDFVQKATGVNMLRQGQKLSFPTQLLDKAIHRAQNLTPQQLQNLSKYSARVHF